MSVAKLRQDQSLLLAATGVSVLIWVVPMLRVVLTPLALLNTHLHELCHALAALLTGGSVEAIKVYSNLGGVALVQGGSLPIVAMSGYVGSSVIGGLLILVAGKKDHARQALWILFGLLTFSMIVFVRGDVVGVVSGLAWIAVLFLCAWKLPDDGASFLAQFLGIQQCLTSMLAFAALFNVSFGYGHSDAKIMEQATGIPDVVWAGTWLILSVTLVWVCLAAGWKGQGRKGSRSGSGGSQS